MTGRLGVEGETKTGIGNPFHAFHKRAGIGSREFIQAAIDHEIADHEYFSTGANSRGNVSRRLFTIFSG